MGQVEIIKIHIDSELKNDAEALLNQLGLSTSGAVNIFLRQVILCGGLPFEVKLPTFNEETLEAMAEAKIIAKRGEVYDAEFKKEMRLQTSQLNKKWVELSNRLGTLAEDFAAPGIPYIAQKYFGCTGEALDFMLRRRRRLPGKSDNLNEFDVIVVYSGYVFYNETRSTPRSQYIDEFVENINQFFDYFPEYKGYKLVPIFSSLSLDESVVNSCTKKGIYAMALKDDTMDLLNFENISV